MVKSQHSFVDSGKEQSATNEVPSNCPICISPISQQTHLKKCKHSFCYECIQKWIQRDKNSCPICRRKFSSIFKIKIDVAKGIHSQKRSYVKKKKPKYSQIKIKNIPRRSESQRPQVPPQLIQQPYIVYSTHVIIRTYGLIMTPLIMQPSLQYTFLPLLQ